MTNPADDRATSSDSSSEPGDQPGKGRLSRPPSDRYARHGASASSRSEGSTIAMASARAALAPALVASIVTVGLLVLVGGVLAEHRGLLAIAGLGGAVIGLLVASAASGDGVAAPPLTRARATRVAIGLALATIVVAAFGTWLVGRLEGGVMDPLSYLWATTGLLVPAEAAIAALTAAWGAGAGPIRWRG